MPTVNQLVRKARQPKTSRNKVPALEEWRAFVPLPVSPVPKHLLLSVFLV